METSVLEDDFHTAMSEIYRQAGKEHGYWPERFIQMVNDIGGINAARHWLGQTQNQSGFVRLYDLNALHLSMENLVCKPAFGSLFSEPEIAEAHRRLTEFGFDAAQHWLQHE